MFDYICVSVVFRIFMHVCLRRKRKEEKRKKYAPALPSTDCSKPSQLSRSHPFLAETIYSVFSFALRWIRWILVRCRRERSRRSRCPLARASHSKKEKIAEVVLLCLCFHHLLLPKRRIGHHHHQQLHQRGSRRERGILDRRFS